MTEQRERRKRAQLRWQVLSWFIVLIILAAGIATIILGMDYVYRKQKLAKAEQSGHNVPYTYADGTEESHAENDINIPQQTQTQKKEEQSASSNIIESTQEMQSSNVENAEIQTSDEQKNELQTTEVKSSEAQNTASPVQNVVVGNITTEKPTYVSLVAVGDNLMHYDVSMSGWRTDGTYNYDYNFAYVKDIVQAADLAVINQECVIGGDEWGIRDYPCFNVRTEVAAAIANAGFDVVLGATNHVLDIGKVGTLHMVKFFRENYPQLTLLGIHDSWETRDEIHVIEKNGIRIGMINYTDILNCKSDYNADGQYLVDMLDYDRIARLISQTKAVSDFVIVFPHWGTEYNLGIDASQQEQAAFLAAQGVDLVIGAHPHVVEPVEYVDRPDGGKMLIYYSLGNFQSLQRKEATLLGGMAKVVIKKDFTGTRIVDFNMETLVTDYRLGGVRITDYFDIITTYPWSKYSRTIAESGNIGNGNEKFNLDYMFQLQAAQAAQIKEARKKAGLE